MTTPPEPITDDDGGGVDAASEDRTRPFDRLRTAAADARARAAPLIAPLFVAGTAAFAVHGVLRYLLSSRFADSASDELDTLLYGVLNLLCEGAAIFLWIWLFGVAARIADAEGRARAAHFKIQRRLFATYATTAAATGVFMQGWFRGFWYLADMVEDENVATATTHLITAGALIVLAAAAFMPASSALEGRGAVKALGRSFELSRGLALPAGLAWTALDFGQRRFLEIVVSGRRETDPWAVYRWELALRAVSNALIAAAAGAVFGAIFVCAVRRVPTADLRRMFA